MIEYELKIRPWVRFWARIFDSLLVFAPLTIFLDVSMPIWRDTYWWQILWVWPIACLLWVPLEALFMSKWGQTPGKMLLRVRVVPSHKGIVTYEEAIKRAGRVYVYGMGLGIIFLQPIFQIMSYSRLKVHAITRWDTVVHTRVEHAPIERGRVWIFIALLILLEGLGPALSGQFTRSWLFMQPTNLQWPD